MTRELIFCFCSLQRKAASPMCVQASDGLQKKKKIKQEAEVDSDTVKSEPQEGTENNVRFCRIHCQISNLGKSCVHILHSFIYR